MLRGDDACRASGMPVAHAPCFQDVANRKACVISSRSVGIHATGLILENYATKGFHVKAKSCNWGPMAGFVLADPRFTKRGASTESREAQRRDLHDAQRHGAQEIQVFLTDERRKALETPPLGCIRRSGGNINEMAYAATAPGSKDAMEFVLRRTFDAPGAAGKQLWGVFLGKGEKSLPARVGQQQTQATGNSLLPVMAVVDPLCAASLRGTYRSAMTGDYDLWAIFPSAGQYAPKGKDARPVPGSDRFSVPMRQFAAHEDQHMGNITARGREIKNLLNASIQAAGYTGGDIVHHSDEAGRPRVNAVEMEFIAFIPGDVGGAYFIKTMQDLGTFMRLCIRGYSITLNPGWQKQLGFGTTPSGNWEA